MAETSIDVIALVGKFDDLRQAQVIRHAHPLALIENDLRDSIADLAIVEAIMSRVEDNLVERLDESDALSDKLGYERASRDLKRV